MCPVVFGQCRRIGCSNSAQPDESDESDDEQEPHDHH